jgi:hypothetical protein
MATADARGRVNADRLRQEAAWSVDFQRQGIRTLAAIADRNGELPAPPRAATRRLSLALATRPSFNFRRAAFRFRPWIRCRSHGNNARATGSRLIIGSL